MLKVAVTGAAGRMGRAVIKAVTQDPGCQLSGAVHKKNSSLIGVDAGEVAGIGKLGVVISDSLEQVDFEVLVDFSLVESSLAYLDFCRDNNKKLVLGTTGFTSSQRQQISQAGEQISIVMAPNMSVGVNLCFYLLQQAATVIGEQSDIEIMETHHRNKLDAPSGTALRMGEVIADSLGRNLDDCAIYGRQGVSEPRDPNAIGFATVRAGDVVGDHTVLFASEGERVEISHKSSSRQTYANGALRAAKWLSNKSIGLYDMQDVLDLK